MNGLSCSDICCLFCCPPCPSRIVSKLAFMAPDPTYSVTEDSNGKCKLKFEDNADWQYSDREQECVEIFRIRTRRGNVIVCMLVRCSLSSRNTLLFSHGNAVDLGQMASFYIGLGTRLNCNIFSYDYSGYGASTGRASEKNLYADIDAAWSALRNRYGVTPENIVLYGQSIGTVATIDLASRYECAGVILHSPLLSGVRVAFPNSNRDVCCDPFRRYATKLK